MLKEVGCGSSTPPPGDGAVSNRQIGTGENNNTDGGLGCGGCGREIAERWYLRAADRAWHCGCLRCCHCRVPLAAELTCFARDGNIYCKEDYYRLVEVVVRGLGPGNAEESLRESVTRSAELRELPSPSRPAQSSLRIVALSCASSSVLLRVAFPLFSPANDVASFCIEMHEIRSLIL
ncbi:hypothetical protein K0M31_016636 [Melipona bicolor]|uniref:LIM zinc-binding domain-containing protein n=1 Tax=Melipona bicolor TaxID=60889 RepID=A0AA40FEA5_9HYME|nr:hypothetical protein K0M31_016636 [Melipona bicolor]